MASAGRNEIAVAAELFFLKNQRRPSPSDVTTPCSIRA